MIAPGPPATGVRALLTLRAGDVTSRPAREQRRRLQHRAFALAEAYEGGVGGIARERREAEQMWPAVGATQRVAYRTLAECWALERARAGEEQGTLTVLSQRAVEARARGVGAGVAPATGPG